jgi:hypothetical protein
MSKHLNDYLVGALTILGGCLLGCVFWPLYFGALAWCKEFKAKRQYSFWVTRKSINSEYFYANDKTRVSK